MARALHTLSSVTLLVISGACLAPADGSPTDGGRIAIVSGNQQGAALHEPLREPLVVGVFKDSGKPLAGARVLWTVSHGTGTLSADSSTASDSGLCQIVYTVGGTPGTDTVRASIAGTTEAVKFALTAGENRSPWPGEPAGFKTLTDWPYNALVTRGDGKVSTGANVWNQSPGTGAVAVVADSTAPLSPPNVVELTYPVGLPSGSAPWTLYFNPRSAGGGREFYTAFWWKANAEWQGDPSGINKIIFWQDNAPSSANLIVMMNNQRQPNYLLTVTLEFNQASNGQLANSAGAGAVWHVFGNVRGGNYVITPGQWYRIELYFKGSTTPTSQDGVLRWWATRPGETMPTPVGDYTNVNFDAATFIQFSFAPTWGGNSGVGKARNDYYRIDHVHLSAP